MKFCAPLLAVVAATVASISGVSAAPAGRSGVHASAGAYLTAQGLMRAHQYRQAQVEFRRAIAQNDHVGFSYAGLGTASLDLGDYVGAFKAYQQAAKLLPNNAGIQYYAAYAALYARAYNWTITYATRSLKLQPNYYPTYHLRFLAYGRLQRKKQQVGDAHEEVILLPRSADAWNDYGIALGNNSQLNESISAFGEALKLNPHNWAYYKNRAIIEVYNKQPKLALRDFQKAQALAPDVADKKLLGQAIAKLQKRLHH